MRENIHLLIDITFGLSRKEGGIDMRKLDRAVWVAHWGMPLLVATFVIIYWVLGIINYTSPNIEDMMGME